MDKKKRKEFFYDTVYDIVGTLILAIGLWCFIEPARIAPGGASGIALILNYLTELPVGTLTFFINIPLLLASFLTLNKKMTIKTIRTVIWLTVILDGAVSQILPQYMGDRLISSAFGGIFAGAGMALIFMRNSTTGGGDILAKLLQKKYPYMQTGYAIMIIDFCIIAVSALVFKEIESVLYGLICMVCTTQTIDIILYGMNKGTMITVHSDKTHEIGEDILTSLERGVTYYKTTGGYSGKARDALTCVVDRKQFYLVKEIIDRHDPHAFIIVSQTKEVYGEGFLNQKEE